jgi:hypothetical protein
MGPYVPTILYQLIREVKSGKYCIIYSINGPSSCNCIGYKPKNIATKKYILFHVRKDWVADFMTGVEWRDGFLMNDCEVAVLSEYENVLRGIIKDEIVEHVSSL